MIAIWAAALMLLLAPQPQPEPPPMAQLVVQERISVRVRPAQPRQPIEWQEGRGPSCVPARAVVGASLPRRDRVDLILRGNSRVRAELEENCPALDYYHGFYIIPNPDGRICADRDRIRSRVGGQCQIERFKSLRAVERRRVP